MLSKKSFVREIRGLDVHCLRADENPRLVEALAEIRQHEFSAEGWSGGPLGMDDFDWQEPAFRQLVAWDPKYEEIVAAYRFLPCWDAMDRQGQWRLPTAAMFNFEAQFKRNYLPKTIELGRALVNRRARRSRLGFFAVWAGLGAMVQELPEARFLFGKLTISPHLPKEARDLLVRSLLLAYPAPGQLVTPRAAHRAPGLAEDEAPMSHSQDMVLRRLRDKLARYDAVIPPLVTTYSTLTPRMFFMPSGYNPSFESLEEMPLIVPLEHVRQEVMERYVWSYKPSRRDLFSDAPPPTARKIGSHVRLGA